MDLRQLESFVAVARHRHFTRAAEDLYLTQSAVSQQVRRLEPQVGLDLLRRTSRGVELTAAGAELLPRAEAILADVAGARAAMADAGVRDRRRRGAGGGHHGRRAAAAGGAGRVSPRAARHSRGAAPRDRRTRSPIWSGAARPTWASPPCARARPPPGSRPAPLRTEPLVVLVAARRPGRRRRERGGAVGAARAAVHPRRAGDRAARDGRRRARRPASARCRCSRSATRRRCACS